MRKARASLQLLQNILNNRHIGPHLRSQMESLLGTGVFNSDGKLGELRDPVAFSHSCNVIVHLGDMWK